MNFYQPLSATRVVLNALRKNEIEPTSVTLDDDDGADEIVLSHGVAIYVARNSAYVSIANETKGSVDDRPACSLPGELAMLIADAIGALDAKRVPSTLCESTQ